MRKIWKRRCKSENYVRTLNNEFENIKVPTYVILSVYKQQYLLLNFNLICLRLSMRSAKIRKVLARCTVYENFTLPTSNSRTTYLINGNYGCCIL